MGFGRKKQTGKMDARRAQAKKKMKIKAKIAQKAALKKK
jgi:hypothetical protein